LIIHDKLIQNLKDEIPEDMPEKGSVDYELFRKSNLIILTRPLIENL